MAESRRERPQSEYRLASLASGTNRKYNHMDVSVIIVNYKTSQLLVQAIDSILNKTEDIVYEIIVVDNHSQDDSERVVHERYGNRVTYLPLAENVGFGRANNEGAKIARGRYLFLLNPDTWLLNNAVKILSDFLDTHDSAAIVGGNLYSSDLNPNASFSRKLLFPSWFMEISYLSAWTLPRLVYGKNFEFNHSGRPLEVGFIIGADMMIRTDVFHRLGGFDLSFFMYAEETDLSYRVAQAGFKSMSVPEARIVHMEGKSHEYKEMQIQMRYDSRKIYYAKHHGKYYARIADLIHRVTIWSRILGYTVIGQREKKRQWYSNLELFDSYNHKKGNVSAKK